MMKFDSMLSKEVGSPPWVHEHKRFQFLFFVLLGLVVLYPYFLATDMAFRIYRLLGIAIILASFYAVADDRRKLIPALLMGVPAILSQIGVQFVDDAPFMQTFNNFINIPLIVFIFIIVFLKVIRSKKVTIDTLYGAASVYLLMGMAFALGFLAIVQVDPDAFHMAPIHNPDGVIDFPDTIYFSFLTLTTLGYGDMAPISPIVRSLAILEAMLGVLYLTILISRLVSIYSTTQREYEQPVEDKSIEEAEPEESGS